MNQLSCFQVLSHLVSAQQLFPTVPNLHRSSIQRPLEPQLEPPVAQPWPRAPSPDSHGWASWRALGRAPEAWHWAVANVSPRFSRSSRELWHQKWPPLDPALGSPASPKGSRPTCLPAAPPPRRGHRSHCCEAMSSNPSGARCPNQRGLRL